MFFLFLRRALLQTANLVSGGIIGGMWFVAAGLDVKLPGWAFAVATTGAFIYAFFEVWREENIARQKAEHQLESERDQRPYPLLSVLIEDGVVYLKVRNEGAQGVFEARLRTSGGKGPSQA